MPPEVAAYYAGIFDGEGTINVYINKKNGNATLYVAVGNTYMDLPVAMKKVFGGYLTSSRLSTKSAKRLSRDWKATNDTAIAFLKIVYPYLTIKKRQAALAFKARKIVTQDLWSKDRHRKDLLAQIAEEIRDLNHDRAGTRVETVKVGPVTDMIQSTVSASAVV